MAKPRPYMGFYRPHSRVTFGNELLDPATGEISYPPSRTKQSMVAECDINNILKQYKRTGMIAHINAQAAQGQYIDLPSDQDFQESLNIVMRAEESFATLPSKVRARFGNDPQEFLAFMADPANQDEMISLGLGTKITDSLDLNAGPGGQPPEPKAVPPAPAAAPAPEAK